LATAATTPQKVKAAASPLETRWGKLLIPSLSDFFFLALIVWLFGVGEGWKGLVLDGDTGWHIRTGEYILQNKAVPYGDIFSYSKSGLPWYAWEWLTDVQFAVLHSRWGLGGVAVFSGLIICGSAYALLRTTLWTGANVFVALVLTLLYVGASSVHHHARPHVWTLLLFALSTGLLARDRQQNTKWVWMLIPLTCLWTNLHGGFLAMIAATGLAALGTFLENPRQWRTSARYFVLTAGCLAASVINPYGIQLHVHVAEYLRSDFIRNAVQEFQSPSFRSESVRQFEAVLILGIACAGFLASRKRFVETLWILYFAHSALTSARHIPLFLIIASPAIAGEATRWWNAAFEAAPRNSIRHIFHSLAADVAVGFRRTTVWIVIAAVPLTAITAVKHWPTDFARTFPSKMVSAHESRIVGSRLFTSDQWGDYILYRLWPRQKVFIDGRSDFYGAALGNEYLSLMHADFKWANVVEKYGFDLMLLPVKWPLASVLKLSPEWRLIADDGTAILFERRTLHP
jgi:hypothetical protein